MPEMTVKKKRPLWYNLSPVNLPVPGMVSIFHRVSGAALFIGLFWLLYLLELSLSSPSAFEKFRSFVAHPFGKLVLIGFAWAYLHHFCAGIRYLVLDLHIGDELGAARKSAGSVFIVSLVLTALFAVAVFL